MTMQEGQPDPVTEPPKLSLQSAIKNLEDRSFKTYKSRLKACERLNRRNVSWNFALIAFSTSTAIASVGMLVERRMYGAGGDALMVALAVLSLVASLVVSSVNYGVRAKAMEANYKKIQQISVDVETLLYIDSSQDEMLKRYESLKREYHYTIESSENHAQGDFRWSRRVHGVDVGSIGTRLYERLCSLAPLLSLVVPLGVLVPFAIWFVNGL